MGVFGFTNGGGMTHLRTVLVAAFLLACAGVAWASSCPSSVWCDYHSTYAYYAGDDYPAGKHYRVFSHTYLDTQGNSRTHKVSMRCD